MSTPTPLSHPRAPGQCGQFYRFSVTIKEQDGRFIAGPFSCAYEAATGGEPGTFEVEAAVEDKILIPSWQPELLAKAQAILTLPGSSWRKKFQIVDIVPLGTPPGQTLLIVSP